MLQHLWSEIFKSLGSLLKIVLPVVSSHFWTWVIALSFFPPFSLQLDACTVSVALKWACQGAGGAIVAANFRVQGERKGPAEGGGGSSTLSLLPASDPLCRLAVDLVKLLVLPTQLFFCQAVVWEPLVRQASQKPCPVHINKWHTVSFVSIKILAIMHVWQTEQDSQQNTLIGMHTVLVEFWMCSRYHLSHVLASSVKTSMLSGSL